MHFHCDHSFPGRFVRYVSECSAALFSCCDFHVSCGVEVQVAIGACVQMLVEMLTWVRDAARIEWTPE
eukprot:1387354-Rhodomonas_salina.1